MGIIRLLSISNYKCSPELIFLNEIFFRKIFRYCKVASSNTSRLEAHAGFFRLLMKGIFDPYIMWPLHKKLISQLVMSVRTRDYTVDGSYHWKLTLKVKNYTILYPSLGNLTTHITVNYPCSTFLSCLICVYNMKEITVYFVSENSIEKSKDGDFFAGVYESSHFSWLLLVFYLLALIGSAGMIYYFKGTAIPWARHTWAV